MKRGNRHENAIEERKLDVKKGIEMQKVLKIREYEENEVRSFVSRTYVPSFDFFLLQHSSDSAFNSSDTLLPPSFDFLPSLFPFFFHMSTNSFLTTFAFLSFSLVLLFPSLLHSQLTIKNSTEVTKG